VVVKEGFGWHVAFGASSVSDLELLLEIADFFDSLVVFIFNWLPVGIQLELTQPEVNQKASLGVPVVKEIAGLDVSVHDALVGQVLNSLKHAVHVVLDLWQLHVVKVGEEWLRLLVSKYETNLALESIALNEFSHIRFTAAIN